MHRRASSWYGAGKAAVGQADWQALHDPQRSCPGSDGASSRVVSIAPSSSPDPCSRPTRLLCLPSQPSPAASTRGLSITASVSTNTFSCLSAPSDTRLPALAFTPLLTPQAYPPYSSPV